MTPNFGVSGWGVSRFSLEVENSRNGTWLDFLKAG